VDLSRTVSLIRRHRVGVSITALLLLVVGFGVVVKNQDRELTDAEWVACAAQIGEGRLVDVQGTNVSAFASATVAVDSWIRPDVGPGRIQVLIESTEASGDEAVVTGDRVLVVVPDRDEAPAEIYPSGQPSADDARAKVDAHVDEAGAVSCPGWWRMQRDPRFDTSDDS